MFPFFSVALPATQPPKKCSLLCLLNDRRTNLNKNTTDPGPSPASNSPPSCEQHLKNADSTNNKETCRTQTATCCICATDHL